MKSSRPALISLTRQAKIPDPLRLERYRRAPELGPKILFFSGGSALKGLSMELPTYTHNSIHLITPFDSGGSSAKLRKAFDMLSVGDVRNRLIALADKSVTGHPAIVDLFNKRFPHDISNNALRDRLDLLIAGDDPLTAAIPDPMRNIIRNHLRYFRDAMPDDFDLTGASIGNMVLVGGYQNNDSHIDAVIFIFSKLAGVRGIVRPIVSADLHLAVKLADGTELLGQHLLTGNEISPITSPVEFIELSASLDRFEPVEVELRSKVKVLIDEAELICYPMGSFFSSLIANLLPLGVGKAIAANPAPKIYIPNPAGDPEQHGLAIDKEIEWILQIASKNIKDVNTKDLMDFVLLDESDEIYGRPININKIKAMGVEVVRTRLTAPGQNRYFDGQLLSQALVSMV